MCGIVGALCKTDAAPRLLEALQRLEYRGYDSAGISTITNGSIDRRRAEGKLGNLAARLEAEPMSGPTGIGHTRWATHGAPTENNAHPHQTDRVTLVHNGIIENFKSLRDRLLEQGHNFETETDTEVVAHLLTAYLENGDDPRSAVRNTLAELHGAFALAILIRGQDDLMFGARKGSPLVVGYGEGESFLGSDAIALAPFTNKIAYLEEGDWVELSREKVTVFDGSGNEVSRPMVVVAETGGLVEKGNYRHYMQKEIFEQPTVVAQTLGSYLDPLHGRIMLPDLPFDFATVPRITLIACGSSYYAAMVGKYWFEQLAGIPVEVDIASEFRYRDPVLPEGGLSLFISQSGETADTMAALCHCKEKGQRVASIINVPHSSMARESEVIFETHAGPEIGVASTKAFTCQLAVLASLAIGAARLRGALDAADEARICGALTELPSRMAELLYHDDAIRELGHDIAAARDVLYLGRGLTYPIAMEGALKLKEISYVHAEGYAAGEMKHGPIALIDEDVPVVVLAPSNGLFEKTASNMQEVVARGGKVILIADKQGLEKCGEHAVGTIEIPDVDPMVSPLLYAVPVQLLAYHTAIHKGTDVDQPRNLAKSVTVE